MARQQLEYCYFNSRGLKQYRKGLGSDLGLPEDVAGVDLPAHKAAYDGNVKVLESIFKWKHSTGVPLMDKLSATPLHMAARTNRSEAIKWLLRYTTLSVLDQAQQGETPVHIASALGHLESVKVLLGADHKDLKYSLSVTQDKSGYTCLLLAIQKYKNDIVKLLVNELGTAAVQSFNNTGINAAHVAASTGNVEALKIIASKYKRLLHERATDGTTPAYFAAQEGRLEALRYLHETAKCDLSVPSGEATDNLKPIHAAAQGGHTSIIKYIVSKLGPNAMLDPVPDGGTPLHFASSAGKLKTVRWLVNNDASGLLISAQDDNGDTPAHDAAGAGKVDVLSFLLENGADMMQENKAGNTPHSTALGSTNPEMANFVVTYSARIAIQQSQEVLMETEEDDTSPYDKVNDDDTKIDDATQDKVSEDEAGDTTAGITVIDDVELTIDEAEEEVKDMPLAPPTQDYATVGEIEEDEKRRSKKASRGISKSIQNALKPLRKKRRRSQEEEEATPTTEYGEMGYKPTHRLNPLSRFKKGGDKKAALTPTTPPPTPATSTQSGAKADDLEIINEYTGFDPDLVKPVESSSHISLGSTTSDVTSPAEDLLDDSVVVTASEKKQVPLKLPSPPPSDVKEEDEEEVLDLEAEINDLRNM